MLSRLQIRSPPEKPEDICKPEHYMAAKLVGKCPNFNPKFSRETIPKAFQFATEKYRLETENDRAS